MVICGVGIELISALQVVNLSAIFKILGASEQSLSLLWIIPPLTGLLSQPIIGAISDNLHTRFGPRRPVMAVCMIIAVVSLLWLPSVETMGMALILVACLGAGNAISQPLRALIVEKAESKQKPLAFGLFAVFSSFGAMVASFLPLGISCAFGSNSEKLTATANHIPLNIKWAFYIGAGIFLCANLWTLYTTKEKSNLHHDKRKAKRPSALQILQSTWEKIKHAPDNLKRTTFIQFFAWLGVFAVWSYLNLEIAQNYFGLPAASSAAQSAKISHIMAESATWTGLSIGTYQFVSMLFNLSFHFLARRIPVRLIYGFALIIGALSLIAVTLTQEKILLLIAMGFFGIAWGAILSCPFTLAADGLEGKHAGFYFGLFNAAITLPQMVGGGAYGFMLSTIFQNHANAIIRVGAVSLLIGAGVALYQQKKYKSIYSDR